VRVTVLVGSTVLVAALLWVYLDEAPCRRWDAALDAQVAADGPPTEQEPELRTIYERQGWVSKQDFASTVVYKPVDCGPASEPIPTGSFFGEPSVRLRYSPSPGPPGTIVTMSAEGFAPHETVRITFSGIEIARVTTDGRGAFSNVEMTIPSDWHFKIDGDLTAIGELSTWRWARGTFTVT
jgi:hypothetical protein